MRLLRTKSRAVYVMCLIASLRFSAHTAAQQTNPATPAADAITIPSGTEVELRFAQPLRGATPRYLRLRVPASKKGDTVKLVSARDVRIGDTIVIAKGAVAQATVTGISIADGSIGLNMRLEWVEDVTSQRVPLNYKKEGKPRPFGVRVVSTYGGMLAGAESVKDNYTKNVLGIANIWREKYWAPPGTRLMSYVHGDVTADMEAVKEAQALLPPSSDDATLTIFREERNDADVARLLCDGKEIGLVGGGQRAATDLAPGKHVCQAMQGKPLEINAIAGDEYYLRLRGGPGTWELKQVDASEGEDAVAKSSLAAEK